MGNLIKQLEVYMFCKEVVFDAVKDLLWNFLAFSYI